MDVCIGGQRALSRDLWAMSVIVYFCV